MVIERGGVSKRADSRLWLQSVSLSHVMAAVCRNMSGCFYWRAIEVHCDLDAFGPIVCGDSARLESAFHDLLANALIRFEDVNRVTLAVSGGDVEDQGPLAEITLECRNSVPAPHNVAPELTRVFKGHGALLDMRIGNRRIRYRARFPRRTVCDLTDVAA